MASSSSLSTILSNSDMETMPWYPEPRIWVKRRHEVSFVAAQIKVRFDSVIRNKVSPCLGQPVWVTDS